MYNITPGEENANTPFYVLATESMKKILKSTIFSNQLPPVLLNVISSEILDKLELYILEFCFEDYQHL